MYSKKNSSAFSWTYTEEEWDIINENAKSKNSAIESYKQDRYTAHDIYVSRKKVQNAHKTGGMSVGIRAQGNTLLPGADDPGLFSYGNAQDIED